MTAASCAAIARIASNRPLASGFDNAEVGSSSTRTLPPEQSARAISTSCRCASGSSPTRAFRSIDGAKATHRRFDFPRRAPAWSSETRPTARRSRTRSPRPSGRGTASVPDARRRGRRLARAESEPSGTSLSATRSAPLSGLIGAREDADQRGFAGPVGAEKPMHLACTDTERDVV